MSIFSRRKKGPEAPPEDSFPEPLPGKEDEFSKFLPEEINPEPDTVPEQELVEEDEVEEIHKEKPE